MLRAWLLQVLSLAAGRARAFRPICCNYCPRCRQLGASLTACCSPAIQLSCIKQELRRPRGHRLRPLQATGSAARARQVLTAHFTPDPQEEACSLTEHSAAQAHAAQMATALDVPSQLWVAGLTLAAPEAGAADLMSWLIALAALSSTCTFFRRLLQSPEAAQFYREAAIVRGPQWGSDQPAGRGACTWLMRCISNCGRGR